jgi:hypothetical protein
VCVNWPWDPGHIDAWCPDSYRDSPIISSLDTTLTGLASKLTWYPSFLAYSYPFWTSDWARTRTADRRRSLPVSWEHQTPGIRNTGSRGTPTARWGWSLPPVRTTERIPASRTPKDTRIDRSHSCSRAWNSKPSTSTWKNCR